MEQAIDKDPKTEYHLEPRNSSLKRPGILESLAHSLQLLNLTHSWYNVFAWVLKPINVLITYFQSVKANGGSYLYHKRLVHGENFVCAGGLWMSGFEDVKENLIKPQARAFKLAPSELDQEHLPASNFGGRFNFLLSLSQEGAGGTGEWEAYRAAVEDHLTHTPETKLRTNDETARKLIDKLAQDYKSAGMPKDGDFFEDPEQGLLDFLLRYLHYVFFGLDPFDEKLMGPLKTLHYDSASAAYHLKLLGNTLQNLKFRRWPEMIQTAAKIYEESPAIASLQPNQEKYNNITKSELALLMIAIMSLAGMVGPKTLAIIVLGNKELNDYEGHNTHTVDVVEIWKNLDLSNRDEVKRYMYECGRLRHPVSNTHKVATEDFTAKIGNRDVKFPKGTIIFIPMLLASLDEEVYGKSTFEFDHNRKNLCPFSTIFHSFGEQTNGRVCPGKAVAEHMIIEMLIALGKCHQGAALA